MRLNSSEDLNLVQISVGPSGLLWAVQWDGTALARIGISQQNPMGMHLLFFMDTYVFPNYYPLIDTKANNYFVASFNCFLDYLAKCAWSQKV